MRSHLPIGSESNEGELVRSLIQQARIPFDDRRAVGATNEDLSFSLVREFLREVRSDLVTETDASRVYRGMRIVSPVNGHTVPRNIGLLFFSHETERWFRGARLEVVEFPDEAGGDVLTEKIFAGPLDHQVRQCLSYLESITTRHLEKSSSSPEARSWVSFPMAALREAVVNAVYHRSYQESVEPTKVYLYPDRIEIVSYPGPVPGIEDRHLEGSAPAPPVPARNRRIGELLKELRLAEGRGTGLPRIRRSMAENGSPAPRYDFDGGRSYFRITLPAHPEHVVLTLLRDYAFKKATGDLQQARRLLEHAWRGGLRSPSLAAAMVREYVEQRDLPAAEKMIEEIDAKDLDAYAPALEALAEAYGVSGDMKRMSSLLKRLAGDPFS